MSSAKVNAVPFGSVTCLNMTGQIWFSSDVWVSFYAFQSVRWSLPWWKTSTFSFLSHDVLWLRARFVVGPLSSKFAWNIWRPSSLISNCWILVQQIQAWAVVIWKWPMVQTNWTIEKLQRTERMVKERGKNIVCGIMEELGIWLAPVAKILDENLHSHKLSSRWTPHMLTPEQTQARIDWVQFKL